ncbi:pilus assembly protein [Vineibacter terrae]|uniref:Pilus assembly protein n=1 Tax=Vineibacter terrae TaxID=2586908 RepID=A0A5C8PNK9_9HYPH|nr:TadE/TadG family type IV pilus assembly protein [Vineibacter terrae]TXL76362.1 pilus assembly protein [Vineibacter terrae]
MRAFARCLARDEGGGPAIEFAIAGPVVLLVLFGCIEFGRVFWIRNTLEYAVEEAARYATLNKSATQSDIQTKVRSNVLGINPGIVQVAVVSAPGANVDYKTITATLSTNGGQISLISGLLPVKMLTVSAQTRSVVPK